MDNAFNFITDFIFVGNDIVPCDVILVPGGSRPQLAEKASEIFNKGMAKYIIFSGGPNPKIPEFISEAEYLKSIAVNSGVLADKIICENESRHTFENAEFSLALLKNMNVSTDKIILVCKAFHSRRALLTYQYVFPKGTSFLVVPTEDNNGLNKDNWMTKEKHIKVVMSEVEKIGRYFSDKILNWENKI